MFIHSLTWRNAFRTITYFCFELSTCFHLIGLIRNGCKSVQRVGNQKFSSVLHVNSMNVTFFFFLNSLQKDAEITFKFSKRSE